MKKKKHLMENHIGIMKQEAFCKDRKKGVRMEREMPTRWDLNNLQSEFSNRGDLCASKMEKY